MPICFVCSQEITSDEPVSSDGATAGAETRHRNLEDCVLALQFRAKQLEAWKSEAAALLAKIEASRDASMDAADRRQYLGRDSAYILTDVFKRAHQAEKLIRVLRLSINNFFEDGL